MDTELRMTELMVERAIIATESRLQRLETTTNRYSRHYNKLNHARTVLNLLKEVSLILKQDPEHWDDDPESVPF